MISILEEAIKHMETGQRPQSKVQRKCAKKVQQQGVHKKEMGDGNILNGGGLEIPESTSRCLPT
jgi:hypothetical protein